MNRFGSGRLELHVKIIDIGNQIEAKIALSAPNSDRGECNVFLRDTSQRSGVDCEPVTLLGYKT